MPMDELLTARQLQELLQVDRTTIYRMLDDGRLRGVKVGQQWRFPRSGIQALLEGKKAAEPNPAPAAPDELPVHCIQPIQDVFAEIMQIGAVTTAPDGEPLTAISNPCHFCQLILATPSGRAACIASWRALAQQPDKQPKFMQCHAGLQYARARIEVNGELKAALIAGQFYTDESNARTASKRLKTLAQAHNIPQPELQAAARQVPRLDTRARAEIGRWLQRVADTFEQITHERADFMSRLRSIASMSAFETPRAR
jgi:excisionase family DNA binding protein